MLQLGGQYFVPAALRLSVEQSLSLRVCVNCFPLQTAPVVGFHEVALHTCGQYFVPVALRLPVEQLPRVRV